MVRQFAGAKGSPVRIILPLACVFSTMLPSVAPALAAEAPPPGVAPVTPAVFIPPEPGPVRTDIGLLRTACAAWMTDSGASNVNGASPPVVVPPRSSPSGPAGEICSFVHDPGDFIWANRVNDVLVTAVLILVAGALAGAAVGVFRLIRNTVDDAFLRRRARRFGADHVA